MPDENVNRWIQKGQVYFWQYIENTRNYPGWHLSADESFRDSFADLMQRMLEAEFNCQKTLMVSLPTKQILNVSNNRGGQAKWQSPKTIILKHQKSNISGDYFSLEEKGGEVIILAGREKLELLKDCISKSPKEIDYSIEIGNTELWFW